MTENTTATDVVAPGAGAEEPEGKPDGFNVKKAIIGWGVGLGLFLVIYLISQSNMTLAPLMRDVLREMLDPRTAGMAIAVIGLNLHFGFTGLLNIGQAGFMLLGAYGFAISVDQGLNFWLAIAIGLGAATVFAFLLGIPTLKLRGDYLAMVTISAAEIVRYVGRLSSFTDITGGSQGLPGSHYRAPFVALSPFPDGSWGFGPWNYSFNGVNGWWDRAFGWSLVVICVLLVWLLVRSPWGRLLKGIREDEDAIRSLGKNVFAVKLQALVLGGLLAAIGGIVYVMPTSVQPDAMGRNLTYFAWTALLLGGAVTIFGPVLGAIIFFSSRILIRGLTNQYVPDSLLNSQQTEQFSWVVVGVALMLLVIFRPQGIMGNKRELQFNG